MLSCLLYGPLGPLLDQVSLRLHPDSIQSRALISCQPLEACSQGHRKVSPLSSPQKVSLDASPICCRILSALFFFFSVSLAAGCSYRRHIRRCNPATPIPFSNILRQSSPFWRHLEPLPTQVLICEPIRMGLSTKSTSMKMKIGTCKPTVALLFGRDLSNPVRSHREW